MRRAPLKTLKVTVFTVAPFKGAPCELSVSFIPPEDSRLQRSWLVNFMHWVTEMDRRKKNARGCQLKISPFGIVVRKSS